MPNQDQTNTLSPSPIQTHTPSGDTPDINPPVQNPVSPPPPPPSEPFPIVTSDSTDIPPALGETPQTTGVGPGTSDTTPLPPLEVSPVLVAGSPRGTKRTRVVAAILGVLLLLGGTATGLYLVGQRQNISEKAWYFSTDPAIGTQCPAFGGQSSDQIGTFQGDCLINYCPDGFTTACSAGTTPGAWSEVKKCSVITESLGSKKYCVQIDYISNNQKYCNIKSPSCDSNNPPPGGCGAKEFSQVNLNNNGVFNEAADCVNTPRLPEATPTNPPSSEIRCLNVQAYSVSGDITVAANWTKLSQSDLSELNHGDTIYYTITGQSTDISNNGGFDQAELTVNSTVISQSSPNLKIKPRNTTDSSNTFEFYFMYIIPSGENSFNATGRLHHTSIGWI